MTGGIPEGLSYPMVRAMRDVLLGAAPPVNRLAEATLASRLAEVETPAQHYRHNGRELVEHLTPGRICYADEGDEHVASHAAGTNPRDRTQGQRVNRRGWRRSACQCDRPPCSAR